jgi:putative transposase
MSERIDAELVSNALRPVESAQYGSWRYREMLSQYQMTMSMSRRANAWHNAPMDSFFKTLKVEQTSRCHYETRAQARLDVVDWIEGFYNRQRLRSSIGYRTPCDYETAQKAA